MLFNFKGYSVRYSNHKWCYNQMENVNEMDKSKKFLTLIDTVWQLRGTSNWTNTSCTKHQTHPLSLRRERGGMRPKILSTFIFLNYNLAIKLPHSD